MSESSLKFLSKLSSELGPSIKHHSEILSQKYESAQIGKTGNVIEYSQEHYKARLKNYMDR
jgi:hypothetical protein